MADIVEDSRAHLPLWRARDLPSNTEAFKDEVVVWLREHAVEIQSLGAKSDGPCSTRWSA